jgi:predicted enzyme related to lactoylglutathione lyase
MILGLRSLIHPAPDLAASKAFFTAMLGRAPYFDEPFYVGYDVGGFELGLWPAGDPAIGPVTYWGVDDIDTELARLESIGATRRDEITDVGQQIRMVDLTAPTGEIFGLIENPNFVPADPPTAYGGPGR